METKGPLAAHLRREAAEEGVPEVAQREGEVFVEEIPEWKVEILKCVFT